MMKKTRIAVISDLHIGKKAVALDLCPHQLEPEEKIGLTVDYRQIFRDHVSAEAFKAGGPIDLLCVTGDISNYADPEEFKLANDVLLHIADSLGVSVDQIFYVPGNHDVHWPVMKLTPLSFWGNYRFGPLLQKGLIFHSRVEQADEGSFHESPHFVAWKSDERLVIGINSAAYDEPEPITGKHHGLIHQETLDALEIMLSGLPIDSDQLRICLIHHHPKNYSDPRPNEPDFSAAVNAENLFKLLSKHGFDVVIHGHKHVPHVTHHAEVSNGHPVTVLGAGSFSAKLESQWVGAAQNQFHVVQIDGRDSQTKGIYGHVATWEFIAGCWTTSHSRGGLCATEGFGALSTNQELINAIEEQVDSIMLTNGMCTWANVVSQVPALAHSNTKAAYEAFVQVGRSKGLQNYGEVDAKDRNWALLQMSTSR